MTLRPHVVAAFMVAVCLLMIVAFRLGQATTSITLDASWWRDLSVGDRLRVVQGLTDGYGAGYRRGSLEGFANGFLWAGSDNKLMLKAYFTGERAKYLDGFDRFSSNAMNGDGYSKIVAAGVHPTDPTPDFGKTFGTYIDGITHFYENNADHSDWTVGKVISCFSTPPDADCEKTN
jgi:hypothetical protein